MHNRLFALALAASMFAGVPLRPAIAAGPGEGSEANQANEARGEGVELAKAAFARGVALYERGEVAEALVQFETAYRAAPDYRVLYNIGVAQSRLRHDLAALATFARYVAEGGNALSAERRTNVEAYVGELEARVCRVRIEASTEGASVSTDGQEIGATPLEAPVYLAPGSHELVVSLPDHVPFRRTVQARAGERLVIVVPTLEPLAEAPSEVPPPEPKPPLVSTMDGPPPAPEGKPKLRVATWALLGVTSAAAIATATLGGLSYAQRKRFDAALETYPAPDLGGTRDRLRSLALATDVMIGVTGTLAAVTIGLGIASARSKRKSAAVSRVQPVPVGARLRTAASDGGVRF